MFDMFFSMFNMFDMFFSMFMKKVAGVHVFLTVDAGHFNVKFNSIQFKLP